MTRRHGAWLIAVGLGLIATAILQPHPPAQAAEDGVRNDARIELGRRLFFDPAVSQLGHTSCASCHDPQYGFSDRARFSDDEGGVQTKRRSQPLIDAKFNPSAHRDGEFDSVEHLVMARLGGDRGFTGGPPQPGGAYGTRRSTPPPKVEKRPVTPQAVRPARRELAADVKKLPRRAIVAKRLHDSKRYGEGFRAAFGSKSITLPRIARAVADYCRSIESTQAPIDRFLAGDIGAIDRPALRGLALFRGRAGCVQCHTMDVDRRVGKPLFTDFDFHNTGVGKGIATEGLGRFAISNVRDDRHAFKTPTLRDVAKRAPYMHDGHMKSLEEVVVYYAGGCGQRRGLDPRIRAFHASEEDIENLVAFMHTLSGDTQPGAAKSAWKRRVPQTRVTFRSKRKPVVGMTVVLESVGDPLPTAESSNRRIELTTDTRGQVRFTPRGFTHVRIVEPEGQPWGWIPDTCRSVDFDLVSVAPTDLLVRVPKNTEPPEHIVAHHRDGSGFIVFSLLATRYRIGWRKYRAWVPLKTRLAVDLEGPFTNVGDPVPPSPGVLDRFGLQHTTGLTIRANGSHELQLIARAADADSK